MPCLLLALLACGADPLHDTSDTSDATDGPAEDTSPDDTEDGAPEGPTLYPDTQVHSPVTPWVVARWQAILAAGSGGQADVFMKVGASSTASSNTLHCFAAAETTDLGDHDALEAALLYFRAGDAAGSTPFDRDTEAAVSGKTAGWVIDGDPSPLDEEIAAIEPRYAVVHYGTNDMNMGSTYDSAMPGFYEDMTALLDALEGQGILPILTGISPRGDSESADAWVETYNAVIRGLAQGRQLPFIDLHLATRALDDHGLSGDGVHLEAYSGGACVLTDAGLEHGYNVRNLIVLEALTRVYEALIEGAPPPDPLEHALSGEGSHGSPFEIPALPFTDARDTRDSPHQRLDVYTGCGSDADESGPEWVYSLSLDAPTAIRAVVLDGAGVDVDLHLLDASGTEEGCVARSDRTLEVTLDPGTWIFALDTYVSGGEAQPGEYLFVVQTCEPGDADCE